MSGQKVIAFIPARGGSKSIPKKNIKLFCGQPLIYWNIKELNDTECIEEIIISTDSSEITSVVEGFNLAKVTVHKRGDKNARDQSSTESVMFEFIQSRNLPKDQLFMLVQCTSPFTKSQDFIGAYQLFHAGAYQSVLSCVRMKRFVWSDAGESINYDFYKRPRRQDFKGLLVENGALYLSRVKDIMAHKNRLSGSIGIWEMPSHTFTEIDEPEDWDVAEMLFRRYQ